MPHSRIREPRRHGFVFCCRRYGCGVGARLRIRFERRWRNAPRAVTDLAVRLQNRQHVAVERRRGRRCLRCRHVWNYVRRSPANTPSKSSAAAVLVIALRNRLLMEIVMAVLMIAALARFFMHLAVAKCCAL